MTVPARPEFEINMNRYAAKLLFQFRVVIAGNASKRRLRRLCEERFIMFQARSAKKALEHAKRRGREGQHSYKNSDDNWVRFEFVGVVELLSLGSECEGDEVWYEIKRGLTPMERKGLLIPPEDILHAFRMEAAIKVSNKRAVQVRRPVRRIAR